MKLDQFLAAMRSGATLHLSLAKGRHWELHTDASVIAVGGGTVRAAIKRGAIAGSGDCLFTELPSQTWRWREPHQQQSGV
jgi:hypothetical protein